MRRPGARPELLEDDGLIVLPQALRIVIPGIVNTLIGLFKDTTLVLIIGLFDLLGIVKAALTDASWIGYAVEGYVLPRSAFGSSASACRATACTSSASSGQASDAEGNGDDGQRHDAPIIVLRGVHKWFGQFHV